MLLIYNPETNYFRSVIVTTGLTVLVDDCIRERWHQSKAKPNKATGAAPLRAFVPHFGAEALQLPRSLGRMFKRSQSDQPPKTRVARQVTVY